MSTANNGGVSRRSILFGASSAALALTVGLTWSPSRILAGMWRKDLKSHAAAFRSAVNAYLKNHGQYAQPEPFAALINYVGRDEEKACEKAIAEIFRTGERLMKTPAGSYDDAMRKYLVLAEAYYRMHIEDASRRFWMSWDHWKDWVDAMDADLDKYDVNVNCWWRAGGLEGVYIDGIKHAWNGEKFEPLDEWYDVAA